MTSRLTEGCIAAIIQGEQPEKPVVQLLNHKKISSNNIQDRYRVIISDGKFFNTYAMLATQLNERITNGELTEFTIISLDQYVPSQLPANQKNGGANAKKKIIVILDLTVIQPGHLVGTKLGEPKLFDENELNTTATQPMDTTPSLNGPSTTMSNNTTTSGNFTPQNRPATNDSVDAPGPIVPIIGINPYQNRWVIKARIVNKSPQRTWSNARGDGKLFSMDLVDESGSIRVTVFTELVDKYYEMLEMNGVYYISRCSVKPANKKFTTIPHDFELQFNNDTQVIPCIDESDSIPQLQYNFTSLSALKDLAADSLVDLIGICKSTGDVQNLVAKASKRELKKRDIVLVDQSDTSVTFTLWGTQAEEFDGSSAPVIAVKAARVTEFNGGKSVGMGNSSTMQLNPDIKSAHQLRGWFDSLGDGHQFSSVSTRTSGEEGGKIYLLKEVNTHQLGTRDTADYFNTEAVVMFIPHDRALYQACVTQDCKKKVIDQHNGYFRCEKCTREFETFAYRIMLNVQLCDWTGSQWVTLFQDQAEELLKASAQEIGQKREGDTNAYERYFRQPLFKYYNFRVRAKMDNYNNESRIRLSVVSVKPVNFKEASKRLLAEIKTMSGVSVADQLHMRSSFCESRSR